jgi:hypothetical protein
MTDKFISDHHRAAILQELHLGPNQMGSAFADRAELEAAWREYGPELMAMMQPGRRPLAWWQFDRPAGLKYDYDHERSILWRAGILDAEEKLDVETGWRKEFEAAYARSFYDAKRRRKHFRWADIPHELVKAWTAERRRHGKTIKKLAADTSELSEARSPAAK